jgi:cyclophilin family peptidyl-prolyl cis-trans isomerase
MSDRRHRQKEQRAAKREAEKKHAARRELFRRLGTALIFGLVVVAIFAFGGIFGGDDTALPGGYEGFRTQPTACGADQPEPEAVLSFEAPAVQTDVTPTTKVTATITTSCGEIVIELNPAEYPATANSFVFLAREGFYDGQVFHRVVENFIIQGGDPNADGTGGPGYFLPDEFPQDPDWVYEEGVVAMANRGARTTGSQFFVVIGTDAVHLTSTFNVLGTVISGKETLEKITAVDKGIPPGNVEQSLPLESVYIESVTIDVTNS